MEFDILEIKFVFFAGYLKKRKSKYKEKSAELSKGDDFKEMIA